MSNEALAGSGVPEAEGREGDTAPYGQVECLHGRQEQQAGPDSRGTAAATGTPAVENGPPAGEQRRAVVTAALLSEAVVTAASVGAELWSPVLHPW